MRDRERVSYELLSIAKTIEECIRQGEKECCLSISEGLIRTGISRAYYSVFHLARKALGFYDISDVSIHRRVIERLKDNGYPELSDQLYTLRRYRNEADYEIDKFINVEKLVRAVRLADNLIKELKEKYSYMF